jgi:hypothetical protein
MHGLQTNAWTTCSFIQDTLVDRPSLSNPQSKIVAHKLCIINGWHHTLSSHPFLEGSPNAVTSSQSVVGIASHPPTALKKHPSGSSHTNPLLTVMRWFTIMITSTSPHTRIIRVTMLHFHVASNRTKFGWFGRPFWTHAYVHLLIHSQKEKLDLYCCIAARAKPMWRQYQTARMKVMFVRWFGRPFWTHTDVHFLAYTHCSLDGSAVHFGLTPPSTHRFLVYIQWKTRLVLLHRSASQTNELTVSDCPNETCVHHILFQCQ